LTKLWTFISLPSSSPVIGNEGNTATILGNMGWSYFELGDFEASLDFYGQGAQASVVSGMQGYSAYWFSGVANSYLALHQYTLAEDLAQVTLKRARELRTRKQRQSA